MPLAIANRYASALGDVVSKTGSPVSPADAMAQLQAFHQLGEESRELTNVLASPAVAPGKKRQLVRTLGERLGVSVPVRNFLYVLIDHRRIGLLGEMIEAYRSWLDDRLGIARLQVTSARPVDASQEASLQGTFSRVTGKLVRSRFQADPDLVGGLVVRHGSLVYDGSLRAQLRSLRRALVEKT